MITYLSIVAALCLLGGFKFYASAIFYVPVILVMSSVLLIISICYRMEIQFLIGGHSCIGDVRRSGDWAPPRELFWRTEMLKVVLWSAASVLLPFALGRAMRLRLDRGTVKLVD
ncbi:MAG TPA: hypothetical protein VF481_20765 [Novosphingobium sp.]